MVILVASNNPKKLAELERILAKGAETAQEIAQPLVDAVYEKVGFLPRLRK